MKAEVYLDYNGQSEDAINYYKETLGAEVLMMMRFKEQPECGTEDMAEKIMHATIKVGDSILMLSDARCEGEANFDGVSLSLGVKEEAQAERLFAALSEKGEELMPLSETFWTSKFGMVKDPFGLQWMVNVIMDGEGQFEG